MTTLYRTVVTKLPPTPLGLLPERWTVEHWCATCRQRIASEELLEHARAHDHDTATSSRVPAGVTPQAPVQQQGGTID